MFTVIPNNWTPRRWKKLHAASAWVHPKMRVTSRIPLAATRPQSVPIACRPFGFIHSSLLFTPSFHLGGRAFGPPLCRGCAPATPRPVSPPCSFCPSNVSSQQFLPPTCCLQPLTTDHRPLTTAVLRPRNAPPLLATVLILPQQRVWLTVSTPHVLSPATDHRPLTTDHCSSAPPQRPALTSHRAHSSPATCLANSVPPRHHGRGRPRAYTVPTLACPGPP